MKSGFSLVATSLFIGSPADAGPPDVTPGTAFMIIQAEGLVGATGTWIIPDAKTPAEHIADPINAVRIQCQRSTHQCLEAWARVQGGLLSTELTSYDVTAWNKQEITAETAALCATTLLTINFATNEVWRITRNGGVSADGCKSMTSIWKPFKKPVLEKLVSGLDAMKFEFGSR
jgi:hypothetical protein